MLTKDDDSYDSADRQRCPAVKPPKRTRKNILASTAITALVLSTVIPATQAATDGGIPASTGVQNDRDYTSLVNVFVGTEGDFGNDMPAAMAPNGLAKVNPRTLPSRNHTGYNYAETNIAGFTHTNLDGVGGSGAGGDILVVPTSGNYTSRPGYNTYRHPFEKDAENASPGYYQVEMSNIAGTDGSISPTAGEIQAEVTATIRSGVHRYSFPEGADPSLVIDLETNSDRRIASSLDIDILDDGRAAFGGQIIGHFYNAPYTLYYHAETLQPVSGVQTWGDDRALTDATSQSGRDTGLIISFDSDYAEEIGLKLTLSPISVAQARIDQEVELGDKTFDQIREETRALWNSKLGKVDITASAETDPTGELEQLFYTHLYRMFAMPMNATSTSGTYRGVDGAVHRAHGFTYYDSWATWDDWRKFSVIAYLDPALYRDMIQSKVYLFADAESTGSSSGLGGYMHSVPTVRWERSPVVIADAISKGFVGIDRLDEAYPALKRMMGGYNETELELGYKPGNPGSTVELGYDQWALGIIAEELGMEEEAAELFRQAALPFETQIKPGAWTAPDGTEVGVLTPRAANGSWESADYERFEAARLYQGTLWQYHWYGAYDMDALIEAMGGEDAALWGMKHFWGDYDGARPNGAGMLQSNANEIDLQSPYLFNYAGEAHLTQKWARAVYTKETWNRYIATGSSSAVPSGGGEFTPPILTKVYKLDPRGLLPTMDNDAGAMSTMYVAAAIGLFPVTAGGDEFQIGSPFFEQAVITYDNGRTFTVTGDGNSEDDFYIQSATLNGADFGNTWVKYSTLLAGGELAFQMGDDPSDWGSDGDPAYSMSTAVDEGPSDSPRVSAEPTVIMSDSAGDVDDTVTLTLRGAEFAAPAGTSLVANGAATVVGLPSGATADVVVVDSESVVLSVAGSVSVDVTFYVSFADGAFADGVSAATVTGQGVSVLSPLRISVAPMERAALEELVAEASLVRKGNYSTASFLEVQRALERAKERLADPGANSTELRSAAGQLEAAIDGLALAENGFRRLEAEESDAWSGGELKNESHESDGNLGGVRNGSWVRYYDIDFEGDEAEFLEIRYDTSFSPNDAPSWVEVRAGDEEGPVIATIDLPGTGGWGNYQNIVAELDDISALIDAETVTFVLLMPEGRNWVGNFDWFQFHLEDPALQPEPEPGVGVVLEAEDWVTNSGGELKNENSTWTNAGPVTNLGGTHDEDWLDYGTIDFGDEPLGEVSVGYVHNSNRSGNNSRIEVYLDDFDPENLTEPFVVIPLPNTGSNWNDDGVSTVMLPERISGEHEVYLRLRTEPYADHPFVANIDKLTFDVGGPSEAIVEAEDWDYKSSDELKNENSTWNNAGSVTNIGATADGDWLTYENIDFGTGALDQVSVGYVHNSSRSGDNSRIEVWIGETDHDDPGEPFAVIPLPNTGSNWQSDGVSTIELPEGLRGVQDLHLRLRTEEQPNRPFVANIDKLTFFTDIDEPEPEPVDMSTLQAAIAQYGPLENEADRYPRIDFEFFLSELQAARALVGSTTATQAAVDEQTRRLTLAAEQLVPAERRALENLIAEVEGMDPAPYTEESWAALEEALSDAREVLADDDASDSDLANARTALEAAVEALEVEPTVPDAPASVSASVDGSSVTVSWTEPESDGGSPITGYRVELSDGRTVNVDDSSRTAVTFSWLTPGETITAHVTAINAVGDSETTADSSIVEIGDPVPGNAGPASSAADDASLASIEVDGVVIGGFSPSVLMYVVSWPEDRELPEVAAVPSNADADVTISEGASLSTYRVAVPGTETMTIEVVSADGTATASYELLFAFASDVTLPDDLLSDGGPGGGDDDDDNGNGDDDGTGDGDGSGDGTGDGDGAGDGTGDGSGSDDDSLSTTGLRSVSSQVVFAIGLLLAGAIVALATRRKNGFTTS